MDSFQEMKLMGDKELFGQLVFHLQENVGLKGIPDRFFLHIGISAASRLAAVSKVVE